ncbi:aspartate 1-decarboxylase [Porcipelethomonas sp.]|uniref:aspartate 1-decarboxylase n=1 Tax=Porcipelethomonas sp. TaxID=2981675 RepID=UPI003EF334E6
MTVTMLKSKIHRASVTEANLNYVGSITIDSALMKASGIMEYEKVQVVNINNGSRFETYVIRGDENSGVICLNGAAARCAQPGDKVIIMAYAQMTLEEAENHKPQVIITDENNHCTDISQCEKHGTIF